MRRSGDERAGKACPRVAGTVFGDDFPIFEGVDNHTGNTLVSIGVLDDVAAAQYGFLAQTVGNTFVAQGANEIGQFRRQFITGRAQENIEFGIQSLAEAARRGQQARIGMAHTHGKQHLAYYFATS